MLVPVTKQSYILDDPYEIPRVVKEAFYLANTGRNRITSYNVCYTKLLRKLVVAVFFEHLGQS